MRKMRHLHPPSASGRRPMRCRAEPVTGAWRHQISPAATRPLSSPLTVRDREVSGHLLPRGSLKGATMTSFLMLLFIVNVGAYMFIKIYEL